MERMEPPAPATKSVAVCSATSLSCGCRGTVIALQNGPTCQVTSETGSCGLNLIIDTGASAGPRGSCCVCAVY